MTTERILILLGLVCVGAAAFGVLTGVATALPVVAAVLLLVGLGSLVAGCRLGADAPTVVTADPPAVGAGWVRNAAVMLGVVWVIALATALVVAEGEATGHAIGHLVQGTVSFALFLALGLLWRPRTDTQAALIRRVVLVLLLVATFGSFLESMGGAGYDAANRDARVEALTLLHDVALPFSALGMPGIVLGAVAGVVVLARGALRRLRAA
jgi:hypothetical protein